MRTHWAARLPSAAFLAAIALTLSSCADETAGPSQPAVPPTDGGLAGVSNSWTTKKAMPTARFQVVMPSVGGCGAAGTINNSRRTRDTRPD